jgi:hypothetical protein
LSVARVASGPRKSGTPHRTPSATETIGMTRFVRASADRGANALARRRRDEEGEAVMSTDVQLPASAPAEETPTWHVLSREGVATELPVVLLVAGIISVYPVKRAGTGIVILLLMVLNAIVGLNQEGKAASKGTDAVGEPDAALGDRTDVGGGLVIGVVSELRKLLLRQRAAAKPASPRATA